jgi:hypothetical protein
MSKNKKAPAGDLGLEKKRQERGLMSTPNYNPPNPQKQLFNLHQIFCSNRPASIAFGQTIEDSFATLLIELDRLGIVSRDNPQVDSALINSWSLMAGAKYLPTRIADLIRATLDGGER